MRDREQIKTTRERESFFLLNLMYFRREIFPLFILSMATGLFFLRRKILLMKKLLIQSTSYAQSQQLKRTGNCALYKITTQHLPPKKIYSVHMHHSREKHLNYVGTPVPENHLQHAKNCKYHPQNYKTNYKIRTS